MRELQPTYRINYVPVFNDGVEDLTHCIFDITLDDVYSLFQKPGKVACRLRYMEGAPWGAVGNIVEFELKCKFEDMRDWIADALPGVTISKATNETIDEFQAYILTYIRRRGWL